MTTDTTARAIRVTDESTRDEVAEAMSHVNDVAKLTIYLAPDIDPTEAYAASQAVWGSRRTAVTVLAVAPARPGALVEVEALAAIPAASDHAEQAGGPPAIP